jgi:tetratricopeptide (TPR) repeat protein
MTVVARSSQGGSRELEQRVELSLLRCVEWSQSGRHRKVLGEVERILPLTRRHPQLEAQLLVWKAQALLSMGCADRALPAANRSWELESSPHACHLLSNALNALGQADESEGLLRMGWGMFPDAVHLPVQLAMMLTDQGRLPEALDTLQEIPSDLSMPDDLRVFLFGLRANLLATVGRWSEARDVIEEGLELHPESALLREAGDSLHQAWLRSRAEHELNTSWLHGLSSLSGIAAEVDEAVVRTGAVHELPSLQVLAARRLWRTFAAATTIRPQMPDPWGAALVLAIMELDGERPSVAAMARSLRLSPTTTRRALGRLRSFLTALEPQFARRSFAAHTNPRLDEPAPPAPEAKPTGLVVPFPGTPAATEPD